MMVVASTVVHIVADQVIHMVKLVGWMRDAPKKL